MLVQKHVLEIRVTIVITRNTLATVQCQVLAWKALLAFTCPVYLNLNKLDLV